jgi:hypothetical protein
VGTILFWRMLSMDEELKAAVAAVNAQSTAPLSTATIAILREAIRAATPAIMLFSEGQCAEARYDTAIALSDLIAGPPTQTRIDRAKSAVEHWLKELRESLDVQPMDYVRVGQTIRLGPYGTIVLSYKASCVREMINGGIVTIGTEHSYVRSGEIRILGS